MDYIFFIQLISSFAVGGLLIALISFIVEHVSPKTAGVILSLPSTLAVSLIFINLVKGDASIREVLPVIPLSLGASVLFVAIYVNLAQVFRKKAISILMSFIGAIIVWSAIGIPIALFKFHNFPYSIAGYVILVLISHLMLYSKKEVNQETVEYSFNEKVFRIIIAGTIITLVVFLTKTLGAIWGGVFSVFPAAYLSSLVILHKSRGSAFLFNATKTVPLASPIFIFYALTAGYFFPILGILFGTIISYILSLILIIIYIRVLRTYE